MTEVLTEVPGSGTRLRLDADRSWERPTGDSVMRVMGLSPEGDAVFDAAYVEVSHQEAKLIGQLLRSAVTPAPQTLDQIAQDIQAMFASQLGGRDAAQIAKLMARTTWRALAEQIGYPTTANEGQQAVYELAERFERAGATAKTPRGPIESGSSGKQQQHRGNGGH